MKLLLVCDEYIFFCEGKYYFRELGVNLVNRYLNVFEFVKIAARVKHLDKKEDLGVYNIENTNPEIEIFPIPFFQGPIQYTKKYFQIKKKISEAVTGCDAAILRLPSTLGFAVLNSIRKNKIPYSAEIVANTYQQMLATTNLIHKLLRLKLHFQMKDACKKANGVSYVTEKSLQKIYPPAPNAFTNSYSSVELKDDAFFSPKKYVAKEQFVAVHVANQINSMSKGHDLVIKMIKQLNDSGINIKIKFAGNGPFIERFKKMASDLNISDKIEFVGFLKKNELTAFLHNADIMVFPSISEGLPRVIIEAMATGLPCVASKVGGIPELLADEVLFDPHDLDSFTKKTAEILKNQELYEKLSEQNYRKSLEYKSDVLNKKYVDFFTKLRNLVESKQKS